MSFGMAFVTIPLIALLRFEVETAFADERQRSTTKSVMPFAATSPDSHAIFVPVAFALSSRLTLVPVFIV